MARDVATQIDQYLNDFAANVVALARVFPAAVRTQDVALEDDARIGDIRRGFEKFLRTENVLSAKQTTAAEHRSDQAIMLAVAGLILSAGLIGGFGLYLARAIGRAPGAHDEPAQGQEQPLQPRRSTQRPGGPDARLRGNASGAAVSPSPHPRWPSAG